jgi:hypothetical protein
MRHKTVRTAENSFQNNNRGKKISNKIEDFREAKDAIANLYINL